jgi:hypothetical protein
MDDDVWGPVLDRAKQVRKHARGDDLSEHARCDEPVPLSGGEVANLRISPGHRLDVFAHRRTDTEANHPARLDRPEGVRPGKPANLMPHAG